MKIIVQQFGETFLEVIGVVAVFEIYKSFFHRRRYPIIMKSFVLFWKGKNHKTQATIFTRDSELIFFYFSV